MIVSEVSCYFEYPGFERRVLVKGRDLCKCFDKGILGQVIDIVPIGKQTVEVRFQLVLKFGKQGLECVDVAGYG